MKTIKVSNVFMFDFLLRISPTCLWTFCIAAGTDQKSRMMLNLCWNISATTMCLEYILLKVTFDDILGEVGGFGRYQKVNKVSVGTFKVMNRSSPLLHRERKSTVILFFASLHVPATSECIDPLHDRDYHHNWQGHLLPPVPPDRLQRYAKAVLVRKP